MTGEDLLKARNALKFSSKLRSCNASGVTKLQMNLAAVEVGFLLAYTGADIETTTAGFLFDALQRPGQETPKASNALKRKFGEKVASLVSGPKEIHEFKDHREASLCCAIHTALGLTVEPEEMERNIGRFAAAGVPVALLREYRAALTGEEHSEFNRIRNALRFSYALFNDVPRRWGPREIMPLSLHEAEVGLLLLGARHEPDVVIAGLLHDCFENYHAKDAKTVRNHILGQFGPRVLSLIDGVSEPAKENTEGNWIQRKTTILENLREGCPDLAALSCATKISTISAGNKFLYVDGHIRDWSSGSLEANVEVFKMHGRLYEEKSASSVLRDLFWRELALFSGWKRD